VSGLPEVATWLVYAMAGVTMLAATTAAILAGLALRLVAEFLREISDGREKDGTQQAGDNPRNPA
jgi:hypothetical protein